MLEYAGTRFICGVSSTVIIKTRAREVEAKNEYLVK